MTATASFIRYPGSKAKILDAIMGQFPDAMNFGLWGSKFHGAYCEPFVGAGATMSQVIGALHTRTVVSLNDKDFWLVCLWKSVVDEPKGLCERIDTFKPSADAFYEFKAQDGSRIDPLEAGFRKLALHQTSYSGLGAMAGGPLGGKEQDNSEYYPACRWRPDRLKSKILVLHRSLSRFRNLQITCKDFSEPLKQLDFRAFAYLDPPYYEKGGELYKHNMEDADHVRLAEMLKRARFRWVLSYDDHPRIRELYVWANVRPIDVTYTIATARDPQRRKNHEIIITPTD